jgi:hypothetical protein
MIDENVDCDIARLGRPGPTNNAKWMTLPAQSGNMSQLYRGLSWIPMMANLAGATVVASV